ncbi:MAG: hypothetical protein ACQESC_01395 [Nanobdellota archaeon]
MARRKPLPFWTFLVVGILISGYALIIRLTSDSVNENAMELFIYIGLFFMLLGGVKWLMRWLKKDSLSEKKLAERIGGVDTIDKDESALLKEKRARLQQKRQQSAPNKGNSQNNATTPRIILCSKCQTKNFSTSNYCHMCGSSLK